jgi:hypothetical protein
MAKKRNRIWLYISIAVILSAAFFLYSHYKDRFIRDKIQNGITEGTNDLYKITYDSLYLDEVNGELFVTNLKVIPDTLRFEGHKLQAGDPATLVSVSVSRLHITGVKTPQALLNKEITGRRIFISDADVTLYKLRKDTSDDKSDKDDKDESLQETIYKDILSRLQLVQVDTISVEHVNLKLINFHKRREALVASNTSVWLYDIKIDSASMRDSSRIFFSRNVTVNTEKLVLRNKDRRYDYNFKNIALNSFTQSVQIDEIKMVPAYDEVGFMHQLVTQLDRFDFQFQKIKITGIDFSKLARAALLADSLVIAKSSFKLYRDLNVPRDSISRLYQYPHQVIMKIPIDITIKKGVLKNSFIEYKERNNKTKNSGKVQFYNVSAFLDNITNAKKSLAANNTCVLNFNASFLNRAPIKATLAMHLGDRQGRFSIKGALGAINVTDLNQLTEPMGLAKLEKGNIHKMEFNITGNNYGANGSLLLLYDDLKLSLLKKDKDDNTYKKKGLASFAANIIVLNSNPLKDKTREAHIDYKRDLNRSFFNLIWKSIFSGIKETAGMK